MADSHASATKPGLWFLYPDIVAVGLLLLLFLPFVDKAIHIDDIAFLRITDLFGWNPLQAVPQDSFYQGRIENTLLPYELTHPLLIPYLLKLLQRLFGTNETSLHLVFLVFPFLALRSLAKLDAAISGGEHRQQWLVLVLFGSLPAFVVNGQNLMTDVPTLAFLLAGTAAVAQSANGLGTGTLWRAVFWLSCALFTSYQSVVYLPVLAGFVLLSGAKRQQVTRAACLLLPLLVLLVWLLLVYTQHGIFPLLKSQAHASIGGEVSRGLQPSMLWSKLVYVCSMTGASLLFVLPFCFLDRSPPNRLRSFVLIEVMTGIFCLLPLSDVGSGWGQRLALAFFSAVGLFGLGLASLQIGRWSHSNATRPMAILCGGWLAMTLLVNVCALPFGSARYLLPLFPILILVLLRGRPLPQGSFLRPVSILTSCAILWGGANAWSDYNYAGVYRSMAGEVEQLQRSLGAGQRVWYIGEWGMRHYFDRARASYLPANSTEPKAGDYLIIPEMPRFWAPSPALQPRLSVFASREWTSPLPLRLFNRRSGAGFYAHHWGMLPFALSNEPDEVFSIMQVK